MLSVAARGVGFITFYNKKLILKFDTCIILRSARAINLNRRVSAFLPVCSSVFWAACTLAAGAIAGHKLTIPAKEKCQTHMLER